MTDGSELMATDKDNFLATYIKFPEKAATTIRFFDRGEKYTVYGSDALFAAQEVLGITTGVKKLRSLNKKTVVEYFNVKRSRFERFVRELLLVKQYCVEVWIDKRGSWVPEFKVGCPFLFTLINDSLRTSRSRSKSLTHFILRDLLEIFLNSKTCFSLTLKLQSIME